MSISFNLNGENINTDVDADTPLLEVLRNDQELNGPKFGCGLAQCGACAVLLDGVSIRACITPVSIVTDKKVTTLEGLGDPENPHPLQQAFIDEQAMQCGYCANGIIVSAAAFLESNPEPTTTEIKTALASHLCRCGAQGRMVKAVSAAAKALKGDA